MRITHDCKPGYPGYSFRVATNARGGGVINGSMGQRVLLELQQSRLWVGVLASILVVSPAGHLATRKQRERRRGKARRCKPCNPRGLSKMLINNSTAERRRALQLESHPEIELMVFACHGNWQWQAAASVILLPAFLSRPTFVTH